MYSVPAKGTGARNFKRATDFGMSVATPILKSEYSLLGINE